MTPRRFVPLFLLLALPVFAGAALTGCGSSDNSGDTVSNVTISLTQAQDVTRVTVFQEDGNQFDSIFTQDYSGQNTIDIPLQLITGDTYRVEAQVIDPTSGQTTFSDRDFVAGSDSSVDFSSRGQNPQTMTLSVPQMRSVPTPTRAR